MARYMPLANGRRLDSRVCMYTNTPDFNFVLDFHPTIGAERSGELAYLANTLMAGCSAS